MGKIKGILVLIFIVLGASIVVYFMFLKTESQLEKIQKLNDEIVCLKSEYQPIRYKVTSRKDGETTVLVKFYNLDGVEVNKQEYTLQGSIVSFDFYVIEFTNGFVAFPSKIFTDEIDAASGTELYHYYEKDGYPSIYFSDDATKTFNVGITALYNKIKTGDIDDIENIFGSLVQNNVANVIDNRDVDIWQKIIVHTAGGIEIIEE